MTSSQPRMETTPGPMGQDDYVYNRLLKERIVLYPQEVNVGYAALRSQFGDEYDRVIDEIDHLTRTKVWGESLPVEE